MIIHDLFQVADNVIDEVIKSLPEKDNTGKSGVTEKLPETNNMAHVLLTRIIVTLVDCAEMLQFDRYFSSFFFICSQSLATSAAMWEQIYCSVSFNFSSDLVMRSKE